MRDVIEYAPAQLGLNGVTFASSFNSNGFGTYGFNQLTIEFEVTRVAATDLTFYLETLQPSGNYGATRYGNVAIASPVTVTMERQQIVLPGLATAANRIGQLNFSINSRQMRLGTIIGTAATSDTVVMLVRLGVV